MGHLFFRWRHLTSTLGISLLSILIINGRSMIMYSNNSVLANPFCVCVFKDLVIVKDTLWHQQQQQANTKPAINPAATQQILPSFQVQ